MNRSYRLVWSQRLATFVAVAETAPSRGKCGGSRAGRAARVASAVVALAGAALAPAAWAQTAPVAPAANALPTGGKVVAGQATIGTSGSTLNVNQGSQKAVLNWQSFNIGSQAAVNFNQPNASAIALNRVVGTDPSQLMGKLTANGSVILVNPLGVLFGTGSMTNVGGIVASTLDIQDSDFLAGKFSFARNGGLAASVINLGTITTTAGGYVGLFGTGVTNSGIVSAQLGTVAMASGDAVTLTLGQGAIGGQGATVQVDPGQLQAMVENNGAVVAESGQVLLSARSANALLGATIRNNGTLSASSLVADGGTVKLVADGAVQNSGEIHADGVHGGSVALAADEIDLGTGATGTSVAAGSAARISAIGAGGAGGTVGVTAASLLTSTADQVLDASGKSGGSVAIDAGAAGKMMFSGSVHADGSAGAGGEITVTGSLTGLLGAAVSADGTTAGGTVALGGDWQNAGPLRLADTTYVNASSTVSARGGASGGRISVWSDSGTHVDGTLDTSPTRAGGSGGSIEVSSHGSVGLNGKTVTGTGGELLLDPTNLIVSDNFAWSYIGQLVGQNGAANYGSGGSQFGGAVALSGDNLAVGLPGNGPGAVFLFSGASSLASGGLGALQGKAGLHFAYGSGNGPTAYTLDRFGQPGGIATGAVDINGNPVSVGVINAWDNASDPIPLAFFPVNDGNGQWTARFGSAVSLSGDLLAVGAPGIADFGTTNSGTSTPNVGAVFMYSGVGTGDLVQRRVLVTSASTAAVNNPAWGFYEAGAKDGNGNVTPGAANSYFGAAVALDGDRLVVGAPGANNGQGQVYLYTGMANTAAQWPSASYTGRQYQYLGYDPNSGSTVWGGQSYVWDAMRWADGTLVGSVLTNGSVGSYTAGANAAFGTSVALRGDLMAVGAPGLLNAAVTGSPPSSSSATGEAVLLNGVGTNFSGLSAARTISAGQLVTGMPSIGAGTQFGASIAIAQDTTPGGLGGTLVVGEPGADKVHEFAFQTLGGSAGWTSLGYATSFGDPHMVAGSMFGLSVALDDTGSVLAVGSNGGNEQYAANVTDPQSYYQTMVLGGTGTGAAIARQNAALDALNQQLPYYTYTGTQSTGSTTGNTANNGAVSLFVRSGATVLGLASFGSGTTGASFATANGQTVGVTTQSIAAALAAGTNVTLQASNDIAWSGDMTVSPAGGITPGTLTLQAGRNVNINASIATGGGSLLVAAGDPGAVNGQTQAGTPTITFGVGEQLHVLAVDMYDGNAQSFGGAQVSTTDGFYSTAGRVDLGGANGLKGDIALVAAGGWFRSLVGQALTGSLSNAYGSTSQGSPAPTGGPTAVTLSPFINQSTWLIHVADKRDQATTNNTVAVTTVVPEDVQNNVNAVNQYTVTAALPGATGNYYPFFTPQNTYDVGAQTGSSVTLDTYTAHWLGTANNAFSFANPGASFNIVNPWFDMNSNYGLGLGLNSMGQLVVASTGGAATVGAGRKRDSGWSQEFQPTITVTPGPSTGIYSAATDLSPSIGTTYDGYGNLVVQQFTGFVDGDYFQPTATVSGGVTTGGVSGSIRGNDGVVRDQQGLGTGAPAPFSTVTTSMFSTTRVPTSQAAGGSQADLGTTYDIYFNSTGTATMKAGMTYGSAATAGHTNTTYGKYVFIDNTQSTNEFTQYPFTLPALYTPTTKAYDVKDTMQVVWTTPAGGVSGTGVVTGDANGGTSVVWGGNSGTAGYIGDISYNASTQVYTYTHASTGDVYQIANLGTTGVISNQGFGGTAAVSVIGTSANIDANGNLIPISNWLGVPGGAQTPLLAIDSASITKSSGYTGNNFRMATADGTVTKVALNFTASRGYDGTTTINPGDIKTLSGFDPAWGFALDSAQNTSIGTATPTWGGYALGTRPVFAGSAVSPTKYATTGGPVTGVGAGTMALNSWLGLGYYLDFSSPSSTVGISPVALTVSGLKTYDALTTLSGLASGNNPANTGISFTSATGSSAVNTVLASDIANSAVLSVSGSVATADKTADANPSGSLLNGASAKVLDLTNLSLSGPAAGSYYFNTTASANTEIVKQAALTVSGVTVAQKAFDNTTSATISAFGSLSGVLSANSVQDDVTLSSAGASAVFNTAPVGTGKPVTVSGYTVSGADIGNYAFVQPNYVTGTIGALTLTGSWTRAYTGSTLFSASALTSGTNSGGLIFTLTGVPNGATAPTLSGSGNVGSKDVGNYTLSTSGFTLNQTVAGTYTLGSLAATIAPKDLTPVFNGTAKTYDGTTNATISLASAVATGIAGETITLGGGYTAAFVDKNASATAKTINVSGLSYTAGGSANLSDYTLPSTTTTTALINPKALTESGLTSASKAYDATTTAVVGGSAALQAFENTGSGTTSDGKAYNGDTVAIAGTPTGTFNSANVTSATSVAYGGLSLAGAESGNYTLTVQSAGAYNITAKPITVTGEKVYDGTATFTTPTLTVSGLVGTQTVGFSGSATASGSNASATPYTLTTTGLTLANGTNGGLASNYSFSGGSSTALIDTRIVNLSGSRIYDGLNDAANGSLTISGLVGSQVLTLSGAGSLADKNVGTNKTVTPGTLALGNGGSGGTAGVASNYTLVGGTDVLTVTAAPITFTTSAVTKTYDGTTTAAGSLSISSGSLASGDTYSGGAFAFSNANVSFSSGAVQSNKTVTVSGVTIADGDNGADYAITYVSNTASRINPAAITVGTSNVTKTYDGGTTAAGSAVLLGGTLYHNASNGGALDAISSASYAFASADVGRDGNGNVTGDRTVNVSNAVVADGNANHNYALSYTANTTSTIDPAALVVSGSRAYDGTTAMAGASLTATGVAGQTFALTGAGDTSNLASRDYSASAVGLQTLTGVALGTSGNGGIASDYTALSTTGSSVAINRRAITLTAPVETKTYDGGLTYTASSADLAALSAQLGVSGDTVGGITIAYTQKDAGAGNKTVTESAAAVVDGATHAASNNYQISYAGNTTSTIAKANLTLAGSRVYDAGTVVAGSTLTASGVAGETFAVTGAGASGDLASKNVQSASALANLGGLALGTSGNGGLSANYNALSTVGSSYSVTPAALVLTGSRVYDGTTAVAGSVLTAAGVAGETFGVTGSGASGDLASRNVGTNLALASVNGLALGSSGNGGQGSNYLALSTTGSQVQVTARSVTLTAPVESKTYDATTGYTATAGDLAALSAQLGVAGDTVSAATLAFANANAGTADRTLTPSAATVADGNNGANYSVGYAANTTSTITPANLVLSGSRVYDGTTAIAGASLVATGVAGQTFAVTGAGDTTNLANRNHAATPQALQSVTGLALGTSGNGGLASNYNVLGTANSAVSIDQRSVALTAPVVSKVYDGTTGYVASAADIASLGSQLGVAGDSISGLTLVYADKNAGSGNKSVTGSGITVIDGVTGLVSNNYVATFTGNSTSTITPATLVVNGGRAYDGSTAIAGANLSATGVALGNGVFESFALSGAGAALASRNVGSYGLSGLGSLALAAGSNGALSSNYQTLSATGSSVVVTPKSVVLTAPNLTKTYDATGAYTTQAADLTALSSQLGVSGDTVSAANLAFTTVDAGNGNRSVATGNAVVADGNNGANYAVSYGTNTTSTIDKANLVLAGNGTRVYNGTTVLSGANLVANGVAGQSFAITGSGASGNLSTANVQTNATLASVAGLALGASGNGGNAANYNVISTGGSQVSVTPAALTLSGSRVYDGTSVFGGADLTATGAAGESFTVTGSGDTSNLASRNAGTGLSLQTLTGLALGASGNGGSSSNYQALSTTGSSVAVTPKTVTLVSSNLTKTYDATTGYTTGATELAALSAQLGVAGDTVSGATLAYANANAGTANRTVTTSGVVIADGNNGANYTVGYGTNTTSTITPAALTLSGSRTYDGTTVVDGAQLLATGVAGQTFTIAGSGATGDLGSRNAGTASLASLAGLALGSSGNGGASSNYLPLSTAGSSVQTFAKSVVLSAPNLTKTYDATGAYTTQAADLTALSSQLGVSGDTVSAANLVYTTVDAGNGNRSVATGNAVVADGNNGANYAVSYGTNTTSTIDKANLVLAGNGTRVYNGTTVLSGANLVANGVAGQSFAITGSGASGNLSTANVQTNATLASVAGLALGASGNGGNAANYNVISTGGSQVSVTPAALTLSGSRVYDGTSVFGGADLTAIGAAGESFTVTGSGDTSNLASRNAGTGLSLQTLTGLALSASGNGGSSSNYQALSTTGSSVAVTPKAVTLVSSNLTKTYDATTGYTTGATELAALSAQLGVAGDTVGAATLAYTDPNTGTGNRSVLTSGAVVADGNNGANYTIGYSTNTTSTITPAALVLTGNGTRVYGGTTAVAGSQLVATGVAGQTFTITGSGATGNLASRNAGTAALLNVAGLVLGTSGNGGLGSNYLALSPTGSSVQTLPKAVVLTSPDLTKTYDTTTGYTTGAAELAALSAQLGVAGDNVTGANLAYVDPNAGHANRSVTTSGAIIADGNNGANYVVGYGQNTTSTIDPALLALSGSRVYNGTTAISGAALVATGLAGQTFTVTGNGAAGNLSSGAAGVAQLLNVAGLAIGSSSNGGSAGNYVLSPNGASFTVAPQTLTLVGTTLVPKVYDGLTTAQLASNGTLQGVVGADQVSASIGGAQFANANPGSAKSATLTNVVLTGADAGNYVLQGPFTATGDITSSTTSTLLSQVGSLSAANQAGGSMPSSGGATAGGAAAPLTGGAPVAPVGIAAGTGGGNGGGSAASVAVLPGQVAVATGSVTVSGAMTSLPGSGAANGGAGAATAGGAGSATGPAPASATGNPSNSSVSAADPSTSATPTPAASTTQTADTGAPSGASLEEGEKAKVTATATAGATAVVRTAPNGTAPAPGTAAAPVAPAATVAAVATDSAPAATTSPVGTTGATGVLVLQAAAAGTPTPVAAGNGGATAGALAGGFVSVLPLDKVSLSAGQTATVQLPADTFVHSTQKEGLQYSAHLADGQPLPAWVECDPRTGNLTLKPPAGVEGDLRVVIDARDNEGRLATTGLSLAVSR